MRKLIVAALIFASAAACAESTVPVNVQGLTADVSGCVNMINNYECGEHADGAANIEIGSINADLDGDGSMETVSVQIEAEETENTYGGRMELHHRLCLNVTDGDNVTAFLTDCELYYNIFDHVGEWTDDKPFEGDIYTYARAYLLGDAPYIVLEEYEDAMEMGDGRSYHILIYRYNGSGFDTVCDTYNIGSDPAIYDPDLIEALAAIGIGNVDFSQLWTANGLLGCITDPIVPIAGAYTSAVSTDRFDIDIFAVRDHYELTGEKQKVIGSLHVLSSQELKPEYFRKPLQDTDEWFAFTAEYYSKGTITADDSTAVYTLPNLDSGVKLVLSAGETVYYGGFSLQDAEGNDWYCAIYDNTYGFIPENDATLSE